MIKRYSFPTEEKANELIALLSEENNPTVTEFTHAIVMLGFQDKYQYNEETEENVLIKKATTYDVDVFWKDLPNENWNEFEVKPKTPSHNFA